MEPALLLNATYEPIKIISWKKAITLCFLGKAEMLERQEEDIHSTNDTHALPSVLRLYRRVRVPRKPVQFSRGNVYRRDGYTCQYCVQKFSPSQLTFDHVMPRSRGGACLRIGRGQRGERVGERGRIGESDHVATFPSGGTRTMKWPFTPAGQFA